MSNRILNADQLRSEFGLDLSRQRIYQLVRQGEIPSFRLGGRIYFNRDQVADRFRADVEPSEDEGAER